MVIDGATIYLQGNDGEWNQVGTAQEISFNNVFYPESSYGVDDQKTDAIRALMDAGMKKIVYPETIEDEKFVFSENPCLSLYTYQYWTVHEMKNTQTFYNGAAQTDFFNMAKCDDMWVSGEITHTTYNWFKGSAWSWKKMQWHFDDEDDWEEIRKTIAMGEILE